MSNNNSNNFGSYVGIASGIAVAVGGLAALGAIFYNDYQERQNHNRALTYDPSMTGSRQRRELEEQEERRRNLRILEAERQRLQDIMEEERIRQVQEERERRRIEAQKTMEQKRKEQEEKKRREDEILRLKTNELAKMDDEFDRFLGVSGDAESREEINDCFLDEVNPNRRIKEEFRRTRQQRDLQRQREEELQHEQDQELVFHEVSDQKETEVSESMSKLNRSLNLDDTRGATSLNFNDSTSNNYVETKEEQNNPNKAEIAKQEHIKNIPTKLKKMKNRKAKNKQNKVNGNTDQTKTTANEKIAKPLSTSKEAQVNVVTGPKQNASVEENSNVAAANSIINELLIANVDQQPKKNDINCRLEIPFKQVMQKPKRKFKCNFNGKYSMNDKSEKLQEQKEGMEKVKTVSEEKTEDKEKRHKILEQEKLKLQEFIDNQRKIEESRIQFEMKEAERLQKRKAEMIKRQMLEEKLNLKSNIDDRKIKEETSKSDSFKSNANDETEKLKEHKKGIEKIESTSDKKAEDEEKRKKILQQEKMKLLEFIENQRKIEESRKQFEMKEAERLRKRKEEIMKREMKKYYTPVDRKVNEQTKKTENINKTDAIRKKEEEEDYTKLLLAEVNKRVHEIREADRLEKRKSKIALQDDRVTCELSGPNTQTQAIVPKPVQLQTEATAANMELTTRIVDDEKREKIKEKRRRKKKLMRSKMKQLKEESEMKDKELKNCLQFINSVQTVQKKTELARLQILSRNKQFLNESIKQNRKRF